MKKIVYILVFFFAIFFSVSFVNAKDVKLYLFHSSSCPHCKEERAYLKKLKKKYDYIKVKEYEIHESMSVTEQVRDGLKIKESYVPITVVGNDYIIGFSSSTESDIESLIEQYHGSDYCDVVDAILNKKNVSKCKKQNKDIIKKSSIKKLPLIGKVDVKKVSLPLVSIVIGLVDGFNPCAMWILLFLITMLINLKDRRRMWILGFTFIISSALVYLLFMLAYLQVASAIIQTWFKYIIALVALVGGIINLRSYIKSRKKDIGCDVTDAKKRRKIVDKIKKILAEKSFIFAFFGIIFLAFSVNLIELACSAGLPVMFTNIIAMNNVSAFETFIYFFLYLLFFMIDDIIVFSIAMITFKVTGISNKYSKYSHLIGGIIMIIIGLLMAFKTEWLMFNF